MSLFKVITLFKSKTPACCGGGTDYSTAKWLLLTYLTINNVLVTARIIAYFLYGAMVSYTGLLIKRLRK